MTASQQQSVKEAILSTKLDALTEQVGKIDIKLDMQNKHFDVKFNEISQRYVTQSELQAVVIQLEAFKKSVRVNYVGIVVIVSLIVTIIYHILHFAP